MTDVSVGRPRTSTDRTWTAVVAFYVLLTLVYAAPLLRVLGSALPHDTGDPGLVTWMLWWNAHAVPLTTRWWDAPIFFPMHGAFALSETLLGLAPLTTPLQWLGASPTVAYNAAFLLSFPAAAIGAHALAHRLTGRHDAALIAGLAFGFSPIRASQMPHLQMLWSCWMPLGLLFLHRYLIEHRVRELLGLAVCWLFNAASTGYYLIFFAVLTAVWLLWFARQWREWVAILGTIGVTSVILLPLLVGYQQHQNALGFSRGGGEIEVFSADVSAIWAVSSQVWLPRFWTFEPRPEGELYPGLVIVGLIGLASAAWIRRQTGGLSRPQWGLLAAALVTILIAVGTSAAGGWHSSFGGLTLSMDRTYKTLTYTVWFVLVAVLIDRRLLGAWRRRSVTWFYLVAAAALFLLALGPTPHAFGIPFMYKAPYAWLMELPGGHALRVPARLGMLVILCLSQAAALAFSRLTPLGASKGLTAAVALLIVFDSWVPRFPVAPLPAFIDLSGVDPRAAVLELPVGDTYGDTAAMLRATEHRHPLVNGFSGYEPPHYVPLIDGTTSGDGSVLTALQQFGPLIVVVNATRDQDGLARAFMDRTPGAARLADTAIGPAFALPAKPAEPTRVPDGELRIGSIAATTNQDLTPALTDGNRMTRWYVAEDRPPGDTLTVTLEHPAHVSALELDLTGFPGGYPRQLEVSVSDGTSNPTVIWQGGTAGRALLGALSDPRWLPLTFDVPSDPPTRDLFMKLTAGDPHWAWSIVELRVRGRDVR